MSKPFNPFPTTGFEHTDPSNRNISPIIHATGGIPERMPGYKKRFCVFRKQTNTVPASNYNYFDSSAADDNGALGNINLGSQIGYNSPFIFHPLMYSITLDNGTLPGHVINFTVEDLTYYFYDTLNSQLLLGNSPALPANRFAKLAIDIPLPDLQYDDFQDVNKALQYLRDVDLRLAVVLDNGSGGPIAVNINQMLIYEIEDIT